MVSRPINPISLEHAHADHKDATLPVDSSTVWFNRSGSAWQERILLLAAAAFTLGGLAQLALVSAHSASTVLGGYTIEPGWLLIAGAAWIGTFGALHITLSRNHRARDPFLLPVMALLTGWGLIEIARLAPGFLPRQAAWLAAAAAAMWLVLHAPADLKWLRRYRYTWLFIGLILLALTFIIGVNPQGAGLPLWLGGLLGVFFQPSELLKLVFVVFLASYLAEKREVARSLGLHERDRYLTLPYLSPLLAMWAVAMMLLVAQQDLGASLLLYLTFLVMLYLASGQARYLAVGALLLAVAGVVGYLFVGRVQSRIDTWLNPWADAAGSSYQVVQSLIAVNTGGVLGTGLAQGYPDVILPAVHTDMPLAAIGEEFGLAGTLAVTACFAVLTARGLRSALLARATFGRLLAAGLSALLGLQAFIIMAGSVGLAPLTGVTLPFVSYGGSSLLISSIMLGMLLHISTDRE